MGKNKETYNNVAIWKKKPEQNNRVYLWIGRSGQAWEVIQCITSLLLNFPLQPQSKGVL